MKPYTALVSLNIKFIFGSKTCDFTTCIKSGFIAHVKFPHLFCNIIFPFRSQFPKYQLLFELLLEPLSGSLVLVLSKYWIFFLSIPRSVHLIKKKETSCFIFSIFYFRYLAYCINLWYLQSVG